MKTNLHDGHKWLITGILVAGLAFFTKPAEAQVVVSFERELPNKTVNFKRTFEDRDSFEMWLSARLEDKGCDPYLKYMLIDFKPEETI